MLYLLESIEKYKEQNGKLTFLKGWIVCGASEDVELSLYKGKTKLPIIKQYLNERTDVKEQVCNDEEKKALGFTLVVEASEFEDEYDSIEVVAEKNSETITLGKLQKSDFDRVEIEQKIENNLDWVYETDEIIRISGWGYANTGDVKFNMLEFEVFDSNNEKIDFKMHRVYRNDVNDIIVEHCGSYDTFGYEIGWKKNNSNVYEIRYKYADLQKNERINTNTEANKVYGALQKNLWVLPDYRIIHDKVYEYNIEQFVAYAGNNIIITGWIRNWDSNKDYLSVMCGDGETKADVFVSQNEELSRYDFKIHTNYETIHNTDMKIIASINGEEFEMKQIEISNISDYEYKSKKIDTYADQIRIDKSRIQLIGWGYVDYLPGCNMPVDVCVKKSDGEPVEFKAERFKRDDVARVMNDDLNNQKEWAYVLQWVCEDCDEYIVEYTGNGLKKTETIKVENLKREEREREYSYPSKKIMRRCISRQRLKDDIYYIKNLGFKEFKRIYDERVGQKEIVYNEWRKWNEPGRAELRRQKKAMFARMPKISIVVPTYRTPGKFLREMLDSVVNQTYSNWELCIGDGSMDDSVIPVLEEYHSRDPRIVYKRLDDNYGISGNTNGALELATGDFIALLDHDDLLTPDALYEVVKAINADDTVDVVYTDEDKVSLDLKTYFEPHFKPDYNLDLLRSCNYICHFFVVDKKIVDRVGGFRSECDGSQDYDFILRCTSAAKRVEHVAKCVYNWRCHPASTAMNPESKLYCYEAGKKALELHLEAAHVENATVRRAKNYGYYIVTYPVQEECIVSIVWVDEGKKTDRFEKDIREKSSYKNLEFIKASCYEELNEAVDKAQGKYIIFANDGIEVVTENWIEIMLSNCMRQEVGIVAPKIYNSDEEIVDAGYVIGLRGFADRVFIGKNYREHGYEGRLLAQCDLTAVSRTCMMISKELFTSIGGFDDKLSGSYEDVDLCLKVRQENLLVLFTSYACMKCDITFDKADAADEQYMMNKWADELAHGDYSYNKNFDLRRGNFEL